MRGRKGSGQGWRILDRDGALVLSYRDSQGEWRQHRVPKEIRGERATENYARMFVRGIREAPAQATGKAERANPTLGELVSRWLVMREKLVAAGQIRPATLKQDRGAWTTHLEPPFGGLLVTQVTPDLVRDFVIELSTKRAAHTTRNVVSTLKTIFDDIEPWLSGPIRHPIRNKIVKGVLPKPRTKAGAKVRVIVPHAGVVALLKSSKVEVAHKISYLLAVTSGARDGELHGLQIADAVVKGEPSISITRSMALVSKTKLPGLQPPKTEHGERDVPLHPLAASALDWWLTTGWALHVGRKPRPTDPLVPNHEGHHNRPRSSDQLRADLVLAGTDRTFKGHPITFHALRRSFSTYISRHPSASMVKAALMGHASETVAGQHYDGELDDLKRAVICSIDLSSVTLDDILSQSTEDVPDAAAE